MREHLRTYLALKVWNSLSENGLHAIVYGPSLRTRFWHRLLRITSWKA